MNILETKNLGVTFGGLQAVKQVDMVAREGEITAVIGPNGAGKTTLFNLITGFYKPTTGRILYAGQDITRRKAHERAGLGLTRTYQNIHLFEELSVVDNVLVGLHSKTRSGVVAGLLRLPFNAREERKSREKVMETLTFLGLDGYADYAAGSLSYGMQKNLEIARALVSDPRLILLDEPASGLNTNDLRRLSANICAIRDQGISVILIEHKMDVVMSISDKILVLNFGEKIAEGPPEAVRREPAVVEAYLGTRHRKEARHA